MENWKKRFLFFRKKVLKKLCNFVNFQLILKKMFWDILKIKIRDFFWEIFEQIDIFWLMFEPISKLLSIFLKKNIGFFLQMDFKILPIGLSWAVMEVTARRLTVSKIFNSPTWVEPGYAKWPEESSWSVAANAHTYTFSFSRFFII